MGQGLGCKGIPLAEPSRVGGAAGTTACTCVLRVYLCAVCVYPFSSESGQTSRARFHGQPCPSVFHMYLCVQY